MSTYDGDYIYLTHDPLTPDEKTPTKDQCTQFEYIKMSQLCNIAKEHDIGKSRACNAFGGDKGKYKVVSERKTRAVMHGSVPRKYVLTSAVIDYLNENGLAAW